MLEIGWHSTILIMVQTFLQVAEIVLGVSLVGLIILQSKGTGLGSTFGGDMGFYSTKRGAEKVIFIATVVIAAIFLLIPIIGVIL